MFEYQSACRKFHSSETAILRVQNDILVSLDFGHSTALLFLDFSAAFNTIDHNILLHRLKHWFGISSSALSSLSLFLANCFQTVVASNSKLQPIRIWHSTGQRFRAFTLLSVHHSTPFYHIKIPWHLVLFLCR